MQSPSKENLDLPAVPTPPSDSRPAKEVARGQSMEKVDLPLKGSGTARKSRTAALAVIYAAMTSLWVLSSMYLHPAVQRLPPPPLPWRYHAFLNFRGLDVRNSFSDHLYSALKRSGVRAFRDDKDMPRGANISETLLAAIEASMISVVLLWRNYASSPSCLDELVTILRCRHKMAHRPLPVFYQVSPEDVQYLSGPFKRDFDDHKDIYTYNRVDGWIKAMQAVADLAGWHLERHNSEAEAVETIVSRVVEAIHSSIKERQLQTSSPTEDGKVIASVRKVLTSDFIRELVTKKPGEGQMCKR